MCGIAGWVNFNMNLGEKREEIINMTEELTKRGPDASGIYISKNVLLGHRRLIVIDPEGGSQPMEREFNGEKYIIVYNGELYNTEEIREKLLEEGYKFLSYSDTEVLLASYIAWGEKCLDKLNGIFSFAIWNEKTQEIFLARDRMGVKPLFYTLMGSSFIFASEIKAILKNNKVKRELDIDGLGEVLFLGPSRTPGKGVLKDIYEVEPGYYLKYCRKKITKKSYWKLESKEYKEDFIDTVYNVKELVTDSIKRQLVSDVPVCCFLSGGLDSSIISSITASEYKDKGKGMLDTFSVDYEDNKKFFKESLFQPNSDNYWITKVSQHINSNHTEVIINNKELFNTLYEATIARDLPGMADVDSSLLMFCKEIKEKATVALSGECADEIFGGYPWYYRKDLESDSFPWLRSVEERSKLFNEKIMNKLNPKNYIKERYDNTISEIEWSGKENNTEIQKKKMMYLNLKWFMTTLLDRKDRMSMATGLEVRVPFCDHRIVEYLWNVPWEMMYYNNREKGLLRKAVEDILPNDILWRKKSPYPKTFNPKYTLLVKKELNSIINKVNSPILDIINKKEIKNLIDTNGDSFKLPWFGQLMTGPQIMAYFIQLNMWLEINNIKIIL
jgi:asparagine synthase (glutamine-hydrolysing)